MRILDSRRLTGPNLLLEGPGAILDVSLAGIDPEAAVAAWRDALAPLLEAVDWPSALPIARPYLGGVLLAFAAPMDALYAATEVNEAAWHAAARALGGGETPRAHGPDPHPADLEDPRVDGDAPPDVDATVARLRADSADRPSSRSRTRRRAADYRCSRTTGGSRSGSGPARARGLRTRPTPSPGASHGRSCMTSPWRS